ncbi:MAG: hypothetical protein EU547_01945 [Promethearchaeota archaeon]|nr:MAG: hypothetical protein EU547_01945 [Candidatus Lokiarchaeota archaeon]
MSLKTIIMDDSAKTLLAGLDYAGKTSIMLALNEKKGYIEKIKALKPTIRVEQIRIDFIGKEVIFWDLGGQERYRELYEEKKDFYFADTDVIFYIIDIQDQTRFSASLNYLSSILNHFRENDERIPVVIAFHKSDPEIKNDSNIINSIENLTNQINEKHSDFELLFQQTTIFDIVSIVKMISFGLATLNEDFFDLYTLLEEYSGKLDSPGLFLLNENGMIICKFFKEPVEDHIYEKLSDSVKEHIYELKDLSEKKESAERKIFELGDGFRSYLHPINYRDTEYYMSILLK